MLELVRTFAANLERVVKIKFLFARFANFLKEEMDGVEHARE